MTLGRGAIFMKYFASVVSLFNISTEKFNLESITFPTSNQLNLAEKVVNQAMKSISKKFTNIHFYITYIVLRFQELISPELDNFIKILFSIFFY